MTTWIEHDARSWKHDLAFIAPPKAPAPVITIDDAEATVAVVDDGRSVVLARARRDGPRLVEHREEPETPERLRGLLHDARTTLALAIALDGWPLIRSEHERDRYWTSDFVQREALADLIQCWEAWTVMRGWRVDTPRIAGLDYPSWAELNAMWDDGEDET